VALQPRRGATDADPRVSVDLAQLILTFVAAFFAIAQPLLLSV
jgi:hypothetical protein